MKLQTLHLCHINTSQSLELKRQHANVHFPVNEPSHLWLVLRQQLSVCYMISWSRCRRSGLVCVSVSCRSAFFVFCSEYRPSVKQQYPGLSIGDCAKKLGEMWSKLSQSEKQPYEEKAQKLREKYDRVRQTHHHLVVVTETHLHSLTCLSVSGHGGVSWRRHVRQKPWLFSSGWRGGGRR